MNMNLLEYQKKAITTKIYDNSVAFPYVILGLVGEAGELWEKMKQEKEIIESCDSDNKHQDHISLIPLIKKEMGDVLWYCAAWAEETGQDLMKIAADFDSKTSALIQERSWSAEDLIQLEASKAAEITKKALRDNFSFIQEGVFPELKQQVVNQSIASIIVSLSTLCKFCNTTLEEIGKENIEKLRSRADRDQIKGSGDVR